MINLSFKELRYHTLIAELQELAREEVGYQNTPLEQNCRSCSTSASVVLVTAERTSTATKRKLKGKCQWCQKSGHILFKCLLKKAGKLHVKLDDMKEMANLIEEFEFFINITDVENAQKFEPWIVNCGATFHYMNK